MSIPSRRGLRRDERGVSEVIGYLLGFLMSVMILVTSLYAFSIINESARELGANAQVREVVNRVSLGVQEALLVAAARAETIGTANSTKLRFSHTITVPSQVQGFDYVVTLDKNFVNGTIAQPGIVVNVPTFNAAVTLPPPGTCTQTYIVCTLSGTNTGNKAQIVMTYVFDRTVVPIVNQIEIT